MGGKMQCFQCWDKGTGAPEEKRLGCMNVLPKNVGARAAVPSANSHPTVWLLK